MRPFLYQRATEPTMAVQALSAAAAANNPLSQATVQPLAGGTTLIDLMKLDVMRPTAIVGINPLARGWSAIEPGGDNLRLGALAKMSDVAAHDEIQRNYPVIANSLKLAASAQLRNMATLGGNVMQRTRCSYFRDVSYENCNKRKPGSGCAAMDGVNRMHAVLGVSDQCIATYPGDFAQALIALDATVEIMGKSGSRSMPFAELHKAPGNSPDVETALQPGELKAFDALGVGVVEEYGEWKPEGAPLDSFRAMHSGHVRLVGGHQMKDKIAYAFGAEFVEVRVNRFTHEIRCPRLVGAFAAGRIMNPRTARSQLMGGLIWGMSSALLEATEIDERNARYVNDNLADYLVPVNADLAGVEVILLSEQDDHINPAGAKGLGELANVGTNAAICNALYHATGQRIRKLPVRLENIEV